MKARTKWNVYWTVWTAIGASYATWAESVRQGAWAILFGCCFWMFVRVCIRLPGDELDDFGDPL